MKPEDFLAWRKHMQFSQRAAAEALGVTLATLQSWERGKSWSGDREIEIDRRTALACAALAAGLDSDKPWREAIDAESEE